MPTCLDLNKPIPMQPAAAQEQLTPKLTAAAQTGQLNPMRVVFGQTVKTCKSCHDSFRN